MSEKSTVGGLGLDVKADESTTERLTPWRTIYVHFECREDMEDFSRLVGQEVNFGTKSIWFPPLTAEELLGNGGS